MNRRRNRPPDRPLRRTVETRKPRKTIVLYCEGKETEPAYFEALKREPGVRDVAAVDLRIEETAGGSSPFTLVRMAVDAKERSIREKGEIDEIWCVFDVEWPTNHPNLQQAIDLARANKIGLAISNPCFEIWLALHFCGHTGWLDSKAAQRLRRKLDGQPGKGLDGARYMPHRMAAVGRAIELEKRHQGNGTRFPNDNPSSGVHLVINTVIASDRDAESADSS